jgi:hypothetical protein
MQILTIRGSFMSVSGGAKKEPLFVFHLERLSNRTHRYTSMLIRPFLTVI